MKAFIITGFIIQLITILISDLYGKRDALKKNEEINHSKNVMIRLLYGIPTAFAFNFGFMYYLFTFSGFDACFRIILGSILFLAVLASWYWILFDISFNLHRHLDPTYIGETAISDKEERKIFPNGIGLLVTKICLLVTFEILYYTWMFHKS